VENPRRSFVQPLMLNLSAEKNSLFDQKYRRTSLARGTTHPLTHTYFDVRYLNSRQMTPPPRAFINTLETTDDKGACSNLVAYGLCFCVLLNLSFLPRGAKHSADYAVARCLSVRPSVRHKPVFYRNGYTYHQTFHHQVATQSQFFITKRHGNIPTWTP